MLWVRNVALTVNLLLLAFCTTPARPRVPPSPDAPPCRPGCMYRPTLPRVYVASVCVYLGHTVAVLRCMLHVHSVCTSQTQLPINPWWSVCVRIIVNPCLYYTSRRHLVQTLLGRLAGGRHSLCSWWQTLSGVLDLLVCRERDPGRRTSRSQGYYT